MARRRGNYQRMLQEVKQLLEDLEQIDEDLLSDLPEEDRETAEREATIARNSFKIIHNLFEW